jgi:hypothetical protein
MAAAVNHRDEDEEYGNDGCNPARPGLFLGCGFHALIPLEFMRRKDSPRLNRLPPRFPNDGV